MKTIDGKEYHSLYEYLGHAAGASLGDEVNEVAKKQKQKFVQQDVDNPSYTGKVFCYTKEFLDDYFKFLITDDIPFTGGPLGRNDRPNRKT